jgi:hypothetical protein
MKQLGIRQFRSNTKRPNIRYKNNQLKYYFLKDVRIIVRVHMVNFHSFDQRFREKTRNLEQKFLPVRMAVKNKS